MTLDFIFGLCFGAIGALSWKAVQRRMNRQRAAQYDISNTGNQLRFVEEADLELSRPINKEAFRKFRIAEELLEKEKRKWRIFAEVGLGAFIRTSFRGGSESKRKRAFQSYNSKRVDFLIIDSLGNPAVAIEYQGSGHHLSTDAAARDAVKKRALQRAGVELLEVYQDTTDDEFKMSLISALKRHHGKPKRSKTTPSGAK